MHADLDLPASSFQSEHSKDPSDQKGQGTRNAMDPHGVAPTVTPLKVAISEELDEAEDTPGGPHHETMKLIEIEGYIVGKYDCTVTFDDDAPVAPVLVELNICICGQVS